MDRWLKYKMNYWKYKSIKWFSYDKVSANHASSIPKLSKSQSGHRVVYDHFVFDKQSDIFGKRVPLFLNAKNGDLSDIQNGSLSKILLK